MEQLFELEKLRKKIMKETKKKKKSLNNKIEVIIDESISSGL